MTALENLYRQTMAMFKPPKTQTVSEWADENRVLLSASSSMPGKWRTDRVPYQRDIMDAFNQTGVEEIVIMASSQTGKSEIELNMIGSIIDNDPGPILYVQPTDKTAEDYSKRRIAPMINACRSLKEKVYKAKGRDAENTIGMKMFPGGSLSIIGANSPSGLASKPIRYLFFDEVDRFPASAGTEGDPIIMAERRTETYTVTRNKKIVKVSSPGNKGESKIETAYLRGTQEEWRVQCPHCQQYSFIRLKDISFEHEKTKDKTGMTHYKVHDVMWKCPYCHGLTDEQMTKRQPAKWVAQNPDALSDGVRSFHLNVFVSPFSSWNMVIKKFLQVKSNPEELKVFTNTMLAETWEIRDKGTEPERLFKRREHYNGEVPTGVLVLTCGIDTQDNRLEYEVVGWDDKETSWGIEKGVILGRADSEGVWAEVDALLDREWQAANGSTMRILATFIDSGGHFTETIYRECDRRMSKRIFAIKGEGGNKPYVRPMKASRKSREGVRFLIGVDTGKEAIMYGTTIELGKERCMHFPIDEGKGYDLEYFRGLVSERMIVQRRNGTNVLTWDKVYERNEPLDIRNYARAAYKYFNWNFDRYRKIASGEEPEEKPVRVEQPTRKRKNLISPGIKI